MKIQIPTILFVLCAICPAASAQVNISPAIHARIIQLEDERNFAGDELTKLLGHNSPGVRERSALAIGRIGDQRGTTALINALRSEESQSVRAMTAFALGEIEDVAGIPSLLLLLSRSQEPAMVRARAVEALGKIGGAQANAGNVKAAAIASDLIRQLPDPAVSLSPDQKLLTLLTVTALLRLRAAESVEPLINQLKSRDAEIRAQSLNALARLRQPLNSAVSVFLELLNDSDPIVRANAARVLAPTKDPRAIDPLIKLLDDPDERGQTAAIRALANYKDQKATDQIIKRGEALETLFVRDSSKINLLLEIYVALGAIKDERALPFLHKARKTRGLGSSPELETAMAKFGEKEFFSQPVDDLYRHKVDGRRFANYAQGLGELKSEQGKESLLTMLAADNVATGEKPDILRALAAVKPASWAMILRQFLHHDDLIVRATAASLLAELADDKNLDELAGAFAAAGKDQANDARLAIIESLSKYKSKPAVETVKTALADQDYLVRRAAVDALKKMDAGDFTSKIGPVQTGRDRNFYLRLVQRANKKVAVTLFTDRGRIVLELFPNDAPITVDNFITLARRGYFNNLRFHRVVPNFVIQGGDPRGNGEGGPGYQIRCEINTQPYSRGALGMALAGKDTGGSQFFITHSPQPHLDGGYTVFGKAISGLDAVDRIARGDLIRRVVVSER